MFSLIAQATMPAEAAGNAVSFASDGWGIGLALGLAGVGAAIAALAAGLGISRIAASSVESIARQPEASGDIRGAMILTAALIEGVALFACSICFLVVLWARDKLPDLADFAKAAGG